MNKPFRTQLLCIFLILLGSASVGHAQATEVEGKKALLVDLLYDIEGFHGRFYNALYNNATFGELSEDEYFVKVLTQEAGKSALARYSAAVGEAVNSLPEGRVDSLITVLQSPYGPAIRALFTADNVMVEKEVAAYVTDLVDYGLLEMDRRDSLLYAKEFPYPLADISDGRYVDSIAPDNIVQVERMGGIQRESLNGREWTFDLQWVGNGRYNIIDQSKSVSRFDSDVQVNIYAIDGDEYHYIVQYPNGNYAKHFLRRLTYTSDDDELKAFQWALNDHYFDQFTSPLPAEEIAGFREKGGHKFFNREEDYRITANLTRNGNPDEIVTLQTSSGQEVRYQLYGSAAFKLAGTDRELRVYKPTDPDSDYLFIPFTDLTNGEETYAGGRYVEAELPAGDQLIIDFNRAYHPYCAFTTGYSCPIPPRENHLPLRVEAGVKLP